MKNPNSLMLKSDVLKVNLTSRLLVFSIILGLSAGPAATGKARRNMPTSNLNVSAGVQSLQNSDDASLEPGKPIERELKAGETNSFQLRLPSENYIEIKVEELGIDLEITIIEPAGAQLLKANGARGKLGSESISFISVVAGTYRVEVRAAMKNALSGRYKLQIAGQRVPTETDRSLDEARRMFNDSQSLRAKGKYDEALLPAERALAIRERILGPDDPLVATSLNQLAVLYDDKSDYVKAEPLNLRALAIREKALGSDDPAVAKTLTNLAWIFLSRQDYVKAELFYRRALAIQEKALGVDHPDLATTLNDFALLYEEKGDYDQSIAVNQRVLSIREKALGPDDEGVAKALNNLALGYEKKGDYSKSESLYKRSLLIWEKALGPDHPDVAFAIDGLARTYFNEGDYSHAEPLYIRALTIREKALGPNHSDTITTTNNLAMLYLRMGDFAKPEPLFLRVIAGWEKKFGPAHISVAAPVNNLGWLYTETGDYEKAEPLFRRALEIREKTLGPLHASVGESLNNLGQLYLKSNKDEVQTEILLQRALKVMEQALGPEYVGLAVPLSNLAALSERRGDDTQAEQYYLRAIKIRENALGPDHPDIAGTLVSLARVYLHRGNTQAALALSTRSNEIRERNLDRNLRLGSERQKQSYLRLFVQDTDQAISLHTQSAPENPQALRLAITTLLRRKGRGLDAMSDINAALRKRASAQDQALFSELFEARTRFAALTFRGPGKGSTTIYRNQLSVLEDQIDKLEAEISARSSEFRVQSRPVTLEAVRSAIPDGAALVELALYHPVETRLEKQKELRYAAYLLTPKGEPQWADLGDAAGIDRAVKEWRQALRDPQRSDVKQRALAVYLKLFQPIQGKLGDSTQLLISPDGQLNLIPFAALIDEHNRYLVERYSISYLTSGRDLLRLQEKRESKSPPVVVADPAFGEPSLIASVNSRQGRPANVDYSQAFFGPLPGVGDEIRALKGLLPDATFFLRDQATKAALKNVRAPGILHIATHGFFLGDDAESTAKTAAEGKRLGKLAAHVENPLLRSGLALAGANQDSNSGEDGVLTALEAAGLDLWGTKLVVLSACDTGLGEVKVGEGVYGLRRALVLAGSESQMISLWPVSDRSTRDLMIDFYKLLTQGVRRGEALRQAQLKMLRSKSHTHPFYWASFIQSGEWGNLQGKR